MSEVLFKDKTQELRTQIPLQGKLSSSDLIISYFKHNLHT